MASAKKLSDRFLIGEELGRGAYGQVYKGIDYVSGDTVAIKQISLSGIASDNLQSVMGEIDLLKTLNHKNIVKYIGSFKSRTHLYIILEYMENGSLASIIKPNKFGTFPESLVAVYIAQVLQGLQYLHEQGVVHRDIKGANILTTKDGLVKLADFGVAAKLGELEERRDDLLAAQPVVGTPYWMAPEVIEMTQVTSSSDIWSVGCLIVELLTGYPPYFDLNAMSAMFRIVQDAMPPLPEDISPLLRDFLSRCFLKDAKLRPDARTLLQHEWLQHNRRTLRMSWRRDQGQTFRTLVQTRAARQSPDAHETINSVVARMMAVAVADEDDPSGRPATGVGPDGRGLGSTSLGPLGAGAAPPADGRYGGVGAGAVAGGGKAAAGAVPAGEDVTTALLAACPPPSTSEQYSTQVGSTLPYSPVESASPRIGGVGVDVGATAPPGGAPASMMGPQVGGAAGEAAAAMAAAHSLAAAAAAPAGGPLVNLIRRLQGEEPLLAHHQIMLAEGGGGGGYGRPMARDLTAWTDGNGQAYEAGRLPSRHVASLHPYLPDADLFDGATGLWMLDAEPIGSSLTSQATELRRTVRDLVRNMRPAARQDARDNRDAAASKDTPARAAAALEQLIAGTGHPPTSPRAAGGGGGAGFAVVGSTPDGAAGGGGGGAGSYPPGEVKALFLSEGGVLVLMELLDTDNQKAVEAALDLLSALVRDDVRLLESLCLVGMVPAVARFTQQPWQASLRLKAASFVHSLCFQRDSTLQLFIAGGGLKQLCGMVADSVASEPSPLSYVALQCLLQVLQCFATLPLNYICRILAQCGLVPRLYKLLKETIVKRKQLGPHTSRNHQSNSAAAASNAAPATSRADVSNPATGSARQGRSVSSAVTLGVAAADGTALMARGGDADSNTRAAPAGPVVAAAPAYGGVVAGPRALMLPVMGGVGTAASEVRPATAGLGIPGATLTYEQVMYLLDKTVYLLVVMSNADGAVKAAMCTHDNLLQHLDCLVRLQQPHLVEMLRCLRNLTSDPAVMSAIKDAGAIACLVPMLVTHGGHSVSSGQGPSPANVAVVLPKSEVQMEALNVLYNLCMYDKKTHVEAASSSGIVPHLCSFAAQGWAAVSSVRAQRQASGAGAASNSGTPGSTPRHTGAQAASAASAGPVDPQDMTPGSQAAISAAAAQWPMVRGFVVPLLIAMVTCSASTRTKLYSSHGLEIFLHLLADEDSRSVLGVLQALDSWLAEDHSRVEVRLTQRDAVAHMVQLYARSCAAQDMQSKLETLRTMLGRSSKLAVALAMGGLVPWLLAMIQHAAPINRVKILDIVRILYEHYPRPKEFILMYKIQDVLANLLKTHGRDADAIIQQAQRLLSAFDINVLL